MFRMTRFIALAAATVLSLSANSAMADDHGGVHVQPTNASTHPASTHVHSTPTTANGSTFIQRIDANPQLVSRLQPLLPSGMTLDQAASGFKNQGQFIAALHVSKNLNIPFAQLKADMTGTNHDSLGQAIHDLKPTVDAKSAAHTAEQEAKADAKSTQPTKPTDADHDTDGTK